MDVDLNIYKLSSLIILGITLTLGILFSQEKALSSLTCFSFIPHGYTGQFVSLPKNRDFCFKYSGNYTRMKTNQNGGRKLVFGGSKETAVAIGESQLLGMDVSDYGKGHDLNRIFPGYNFDVYAAPNNGPYEALAQVGRLSNELSIAERDVVVGFNYSTDIFRIRRHWRPQNFVALNASDLEWIFYIPMYHEVLLLNARLSGVKFGSAVSNASATLNYYFSMNDIERTINIGSWLTRLADSDLQLARHRSLVIFPPYWFYSGSDKQRAKILKDYKSFACQAFDSKFFEAVLLGKLSDISPPLAEDNRHFLQGYIDYDILNCN